MLKRFLVTFAVLSCALAVQNANAVWDYVHRTFSGTYVMYGGYPSAEDARAPTPGDSKVAFNLTGNPAKEMFDAIGPDMKGGCASMPVRVRQRDMLVCRYRPKDGYKCNFAFDLSTGLSVGGQIGGAVCQD
jgi:hypothetical protein